jgi:hypothetical protein
MTRLTSIALLGACVLCALPSPAAQAQEALNMDAATQPSPGVIYLYERARYTRYGGSPHEPDPGEPRSDRTNLLELDTTIMAGLTTNLALIATIPIERREDRASGESIDTDLGVADPELLFKYRLYKSDSGSLDTLRIAALIGAEVPSGDGNFTSGSVDPIVGAALTMIRGRHGFNAAGRFKLNTGGDASGNLGGDGPDDALRLDGSYLFRLAPGTWAADSDAALYAVAEINSLYETGGDTEILFAPGLLLEGRTWAGEIGARIPVYEDVDERPEVEWGFVVGVRFFF